MTPYLYMFKTSGLQRYIFATQPLREAIGASQLIIDLTQSHLDAALAAAALTDRYEIIQRAAGSAIIEFEDLEAVQSFYGLWPLLVSQLAPQLEIDQWAAPRRKGHFFEDLLAGWEALRGRRNIAPPPLPEVAPVVRRSTLSAQAVTAAHPHAPKEVVDASSRRKLKVAWEHQGTAAGVATEDVKDSWQSLNWAVDLSHIAGGEDSFMAVVHADGNRVGGFLIEVAQAIEQGAIDDDKEVAAFYKRFSEELAQATEKAVIDALQLIDVDVEMSVTVPARPVVIGGDDVTLIVPAEDGLAVTERFLQSFATYTGEMLARLSDDYGQLDPLKRDQFTACAGLVYQKQKYPLLQGYEQAEALCSFAKREGARTDGTTTSGLLFTRLLDSDPVDLRERINANFIDEDSSIRIGAGPYAIEADQGLVTIDQLRTIASDLRHKKLARNSAREIIDHLHRDPLEAERVLDRALHVGGVDAEEALHHLKAGLASRTRHTAGFKTLSLLPDAAILAKFDYEEEQ